MPTDDEDRASFLRYRTAAHEFGISISTLQRLVREGELPAYRVGARITLLARSDIEDYLVQHCREVANASTS